MEITTQSIVSEIVRYNHKTAQIFENKRINFCCGGDKSLDQACLEANVDINKLIPQLNMAMGSNQKDAIYIESLSLDSLCDYIEHRHHSYINENLPFIYQKIVKLCDSHGNRHREVFAVKTLFEEVAKQLSSHMKKEELMLFPYIKKLIKASKDNIEFPDPIFDSLEDYLMKGKSEHLSHYNIFKKITELTNKYTKPEGGCNTFEVTYRSLEDFDSDLRAYDHLETNILYPKVLILKNQIGNN